MLAYPGADGAAREVARAPRLTMLDWPAADLLVGVDYRGDVFVSRNRGRDWQSSGSIGGPPGALEVTERGWYAATGATVVASVDQGRTWSVVA